MRTKFRTTHLDLLLLGRLLLNLDFLHGHVGIHGGRLLDGFGQGPVVVDGIAVGLYRDFLLHSGLYDTVSFGFVLFEGTLILVGLW